jgi:hypothetical protein
MADRPMQNGDTPVLRREALTGRFCLSVMLSPARNTFYGDSCAQGRLVRNWFSHFQDREESKRLSTAMPSHRAWYLITLVRGSDFSRNAANITFQVTRLLPPSRRRHT